MNKIFCIICLLSTNVIASQSSIMPLLPTQTEIPIDSNTNTGNNIQQNNFYPDPTPAASVPYVIPPAGDNNSQQNQNNTTNQQQNQPQNTQPTQPTQVIPTGTPSVIPMRPYSTRYLGGAGLPAPGTNGAQPQQGPTTIIYR